MAIICREYKLLFIMTPRTACTAIGELLCSNLGGEFMPKEDILDSTGNIEVQKKHSTLKELLDNQLVTEKEIQSYTKFCAVRNPFDSLASLYIKKREKYQPLLDDPESWVHRTPKYVRDMAYCSSHSFESWIRRDCSRKMIKRLLGFKPSMFSQYTEGVDVVMHYESIQEEFKRVLKLSGISQNYSIPMVNRTTERFENNYRKYYSDFARKLVELAYHYDLQTYGYSF